jgi:uncharacterized alkaline shock family protein YloU
MMTNPTSTISPDIIKDVARLTTLATPGVLALVDATGLLGRVKYRGVEVDMDGEHAAIRLHVVAATGHNLRELGAEVQRAVADAVDEMTGMYVKRVDVTFEDARNEK